MPLDPVRPAPVGPRRSIDLDSVEALRLLGSVSFGRIVFTRHALPTVRPVNHVLVDGDIVIRTHEGAALTARTRQAGDLGVVVAYEADCIDPDTHLGWSVVVTGYAHLVHDPDELARYQSLLRPWVERTMDYAVRIRPDLITGIRLAPSEAPGGANGSAVGRGAADATGSADGTGAKGGDGSADAAGSPSPNGVVDGRTAG